MSRRWNAGAIFWGLFLIEIGGVALVQGLGYSVSFWGMLARYWPLLIVAWGLVKLIDYYRVTRVGDGRSLFSGGEVALLILVILSGSVLTAAANLNPSLAVLLNFPEDLDLWDITGNSYEYDERHEARIQRGSTVEIRNTHGSVDVQPSATNRLILDIKKTVRAASSEEADRRAGEFTFSIRDEGGRVRIASTRDGNLDGSQSQVGVRVVDQEQRYKSSIRIQIPAGVSIVIRNSYGRVHVRDIKGNAWIRNRYSAVHAVNIAGRVEITGRNNAVDIDTVIGPVKVETSFNRLSIRNPLQGVEARNRHGDVVVCFERSPQHYVSVSGDDADIAIDMPAGSAFNMEARTQSGRIESDFDEIQISSSGPQRSASGRVGGGGPKLRIQTQSGNIRISQS